MKKIFSITLVLAILSVGLLVAQAEGLLTEAQQTFFDNKEATVTAMVEDGRLTSDRAESFLTNLEQKLTDGVCEQTGEECDGTCEPQLDGTGAGEGIQAQAHLGEGLGQNGEGVCDFSGEGMQASGAQNGINGEEKGPHGDGVCDLGLEGECDEPQLNSYGTQAELGSTGNSRQNNNGNGGK